MLRPIAHRGGRAATAVLVLLSSLALLGLFTSCARTPQPGTIAGLADFRMTVAMTDNGFELTCAHGCAWEELSWAALPDGTSQAVDGRGLTARSAVPRGPGAFLITVGFDGEEVVLEGVQGTGWRELRLSCPLRHCAAEIDEVRYEVGEGPGSR